MPQVHFLPADSRIEVESGTNLLAVARHAGVVIDAPCDGVGTCGKCRVRLPDGASGIRRLPGCHSLTAAEEESGWVLACAAEVVADVQVELPATGQTMKITSHGRSSVVTIDPFVRKVYAPQEERTAVHAGTELLGHEPGATTTEHYGLAVDIGTTTLVVALIDLGDGRELATASALNPQARHAQDVLSRIRLASEPAGLALLQGEVVKALNRLVAEVSTAMHIQPERIYEAVFSGNTCMLHLAAGVSPAPLGKYPYTPPLPGDCHLPAAALGLNIAPSGLVYLPAVISAYVGADLTAGIQATALQREERSVLLIDIGTNGEMILAHNGRLLATSTAAGPAFEGMNIACGMRAAAGAIERVTVDATGGLELGVIGAGEPRGLCGSGLLDLVAELVRTGVVISTGAFTSRDADLPAALRERLVLREGKPVFALSDAVWLGRSDLRQVQLAKGAVRAGIELLLRHAGVEAADVATVLIAGSFGYHLRPESLLTLGLLPPEFAGRIEFVGNTAKTGAVAFLLNHPCRTELAAVAAGVDVVELAARPDFQRVFVASLGF